MARRETKRVEPQMPSSGKHGADLTEQIVPRSRDEEEAIVQELSNHIGGRMANLNAAIQKPNCKNFDEVVPTLNRGKELPETPAWFGTLVPQGSMMTVVKNGLYTAVGPGRHRLWNLRASFSKSVDLGAGFQQFHDGPITVLRIPNAHYALCWEGTDPVIISGEEEGFHAVNSEYFAFEKFVPITSTHFSHGPYHVLRVPRGHYALVSESGKPALLPRGYHVFNSQTFRYVGMKSMEESSFRHDTITRFIVRAGAIGLAWREKTNALFLDTPGTYLIDSAMFEYEKTVSVEEKEITCGNKKIITVRDGEVGISHDNGELTILEPGRHFIKKPGHHFDEFVSTQQRCLALEKEDSRGNFMVCETRELVQVGVQAFVFYHIAKPKKAVVKIGTRRQIEKFINETATAVITTIIRSTSLAEISKAGKKEKKVKMTDARNDLSDDDDDNVEKSGGLDPNLPFFDRVKDDFILRLQENFLNDYGIYMLNVRIGDFKVLEASISKQIAAHALITAETQANLANLEGRRQIDLVNKDSDARLDRMQAEIEAYKFTSRNKAEAMSLQETAQAKSEASRLEAEAEAETVKILAEAAEARANATRVEATAQAFSIEAIGQAKANATRLRGEAEADRAERLSKTTFGRDEAMALVKARVVKESLSGVEKTVYMPTELQNNPFSFFADGGIGGRKN